MNINTWNKIHTESENDNTQYIKVYRGIGII
jgi:hypothetical protein